MAQSTSMVSREIPDARWEQIGLKSKDVMAVGISPVYPARFVAVDAQGRVYRSEDEGRTW